MKIKKMKTWKTIRAEIHAEGHKILPDLFKTIN